MPERGRDTKNCRIPALARIILNKHSMYTGKKTYRNAVFMVLSEL